MRHILLLQRVTRLLHRAASRHHKHGILLETGHRTHHRDGQILRITAPPHTHYRQIQAENRVSSQLQLLRDLTRVVIHLFLGQVDSLSIIPRLCPHLHDTSFRIRIASHQHGLGLLLQSLRNLGHQIGTRLIHQQRAELRHAVQHRLVPLGGGDCAQSWEGPIVQRLHHHLQTHCESANVENPT